MMTAISLSMTAMMAEPPGGPEAISARTLPVPTAGPGQLVVQIAAAGVNRPDVLQRSGAYPPPPGHSPVLGLEAAGHVAAVGAGVERFRVGDAVTGLLNGGGYAEYAIFEAGATLPIPAGVSLVEAAAIPETFFTVWHNVFERGGLKSGEWLLVHGGSSGIGTVAIMLAKAFGARVIATAGSAEKCEACKQLGADAAFNYRDGDFVAAVKSATDGHGADVILDMVGGAYVDRNIQAAAVEGRIVQIAFMQGSKITADIAPLMQKRLTYTGSTMRPRTNAFKARLAGEIEAQCLAAAGKGNSEADHPCDVPAARCWRRTPA